MNNRIQKKLQQDKKLLSIYFTAGYPNLEDTVPILKSLEANGVDMVEIGLPFSDPLADGPTIQDSSTKAIQNGMNTATLFEQLEDIRDHVSIPLIIMGYFNPILQYGVEAFCKKCKDIGIDGLILPDLPLAEYEEHYKPIFQKNGLSNITVTLAMARTSEPHSASSQFFINVNDNFFLDHKSETDQGWGYAVFGKVTEGMETIEKIKVCKTNSQSGHQDVPEEDVIIKSAKMFEDS